MANFIEIFNNDMDWSDYSSSMIQLRLILIYIKRTIIGDVSNLNIYQIMNK